MSDLNDAIDRALDAAEAKMDDDKEVIQDAPETESPKTEDIQETIATKEILDNKSERPAQKVRDQSGKFTKAKQPTPTTDADAEQVSDQSAEGTEGEAVTEGTEGAPPIEFPTFWSAELKEAVAKSPPEAQAALVAYEAQRTEWANRIANESERGKAIEKRASEVFEPYRLKLQANGIQDPFEAANRLLAWNEIFEKSPKDGIADLMRKNGLTPDDFYEDGPQIQQNPVNDPRVDEALAKADAANKRFEEWQEQQRTAQLAREVEAFKESKDATGQSRRGFVEMYAPQIDRTVASIQAQYPQMSLTEALTHATEFVRTEVNKLHGIAGKPQIQKAPQVDAVKRAKLAASSVTGAPSSGTSASRPRAKTIDEALDRAEEQLGIR